MEMIKSKSLSRSLLKGTVLNFGLQLANRNLSKNNFWQTLLVGAAGGFGDYFGGNTAMGAIIGGGNALINKTKDFSTAIKYAAIGGAADLLLNVTEAKAEEPLKKKYIDPNCILQRKGIIQSHGHYIILKNSSYGENGEAQIELSNNFQYQCMIDAFNLANKTKTFQNALKLFENKNHSLVFMECDLIDNGIYGSSECCMMSKYGEHNFTSYNKKCFLQRPELYHYSVRIKLFPLEMSDFTIKRRIVKLAVVLGHELFIHSRHLEAINLWQTQKFQESLDKEMEDSGFDGNIDHKNYMQGHKTNMNQYLKELKSIAPSIGIPLSEIQLAINEHDESYKLLINK
jgi:hypothetical protein